MADLVCVMTVNPRLRRAEVHRHDGQGARPSRQMIRDRPVHIENRRRRRSDDCAPRGAGGALPMCLVRPGLGPPPCSRVALGGRPHEGPTRPEHLRGNPRGPPATPPEPRLRAGQAAPPSVRPRPVRPTGSEGCQWRQLQRVGGVVDPPCPPHPLATTLVVVGRLQQARRPCRVAVGGKNGLRPPRWCRRRRCR